MPSTLRSNCFSVIIRVIRLIRGRPRDAGGCKGLTTNGILADRSTDTMQLCAMLGAGAA